MNEEQTLADILAERWGTTPEDALHQLREMERDAIEKLREQDIEDRKIIDPILKEMNREGGTK